MLKCIMQSKKKKIRFSLFKLKSGVGALFIVMDTQGRNYNKDGRNHKHRKKPNADTICQISNNPEFSCSPHSLFDIKLQTNNQLKKETVHRTSRYSLEQNTSNTFTWRTACVELEVAQKGGSDERYKNNSLYNQMTLSSVLLFLAFKSTTTDKCIHI